MLVLSMISMVAMAAMAVYVYFSAHFASTRQMALVPLMACGMELLAMGLLSAQFVLVTVLLCALRVGILLCCVAELRRDRARQRRRQRQRASLARQMACTDPLCEVPAGKCVVHGAVA